MSSYAGAEWLERSLKLKGRTLSAFGRQVADLLGDLFLGIYHEEQAVKHNRVDWSAHHWIEVVVYSGGRFATFDTDYLTRLVVLCHDRCIRCEIGAAGPKYLKLAFSPREGRSGELYLRHPTMEDAIARTRAIFSETTEASHA